MAVQDKYSSWWSLGQQLDEYTKYEKCRNITEEIYKRINMFEVKKSEFEESKPNQSDISDNSSQIDSNELSNETDLFACDKSDISSSETDKPPLPPPVININNNNVDKPPSKRVRKRFRKRVKKRPPNRKRSDSEGSSDEAPLVRSTVLSPDQKPKPHAKHLVIPQKNLTLRDLLKCTDDVKIPTVIIEKMNVKDSKKEDAIDKKEQAVDKRETIDKREAIDKRGETTDKSDDVAIDKKSTNKVTEWKSCTVCNLSFRGERGLRRHISMTHITADDN